MQQPVPHYLVFDTETFDYYINKHAPASDVDNWPTMSQLAWALYDKDVTLIRHTNYLVNTDGFAACTESTALGEVSHRVGIKLGDVLQDFINSLDAVEVLVGHNVDYDANIVGAELHRLSMTSVRLKYMPRACTMKASKEHCQLPYMLPSGTMGYKWPTLTELYRDIFSRNFEGAHDALNDVLACGKCLFALQYMGLVA